MYQEFLLRFFNEDFSTGTYVENILPLPLPLPFNTRRKRFDFILVG